MNNAFIFSGQGSQKEGMGYELYCKNAHAKRIYDIADEIVGEKLSERIFRSTELELMDTRLTQPAIFIYEVAAAASQNDIKPDCVAGHSLGEYAALVTCGALSFEEALPFVMHRGLVFHEAFQKHPSAMGAIIGIADNVVLDVLAEVGAEDNEKLYVANYNGPGQLVITGARNSIKKACKRLKAMDAKRALLLPMKGVGHSPNSAEESEILAKELRKLTFNDAKIPIYQDADGIAHTDAGEILENQIKLMTYPVLWTDIIMNMKRDGVTVFYEVGTDDTLQKITARMCPDLLVTSIWIAETYKNINPYKIS